MTTETRIAALEDELTAAWVALDAAAAATTAAGDAIWTARTDRAEDKAQAAWNKAHEAQDRAAGRLHAANRALDRPARDDRRGCATLDCSTVQRTTDSIYCDDCNGRT